MGPRRRFVTHSETSETLEKARTQLQEIEEEVAHVANGDGGEFGVAKLESLARLALDGGAPANPLASLIHELKHRVKEDNDPGWLAHALFEALVIRGQIERMTALLSKFVDPQ